MQPITDVRDSYWGKGYNLTVRGMVMRKAKGIMISIVMLLTVLMVACNGDEEVNSENSSQDVVMEQLSEGASEESSDTDVEEELNSSEQEAATSENVSEENSETAELGVVG